VSPPLLEVRDLQVEYRRGQGTVRAVDGVSLELEPGETLGIVGESGAGKSSALMAVPRLLPRGGSIHPSSRIRLRGVDLTGAGPEQLRRARAEEIGVIFQQPGASLNPVHRAGRAVAEAVREGRGLSGAELRDEVLGLLARAGLDDPERASRSYPHQLSGGMQQRVALAAAVGGGPSLLLADEPTAALDVVVEAEVLDRIAELQRDAGMGMVLVSHDLRMVAGVADRVAVMYGGRVVEAGPAGDVLGEPSHDYTRSLLEAAPRIPRSSAGTGSATVADGTETGAAESTSARTRSPLLEAKGLCRRYRRGGWTWGRGERVVAVDGVSLTLGHGEAVGLVGASGAGKTTLARMITGAREPDEGELLWRGRAVSSMGRRERGEYRRSAQLIHQDPFSSLNPRMSVSRALREPLEVHGLASGERARRRAEELLARVDLGPDALDTRPRQLSGGERQRVALARALAVRPALLAADEPVSALDVSVQARILDLLAELREELELTLLLVAHDLAVVRQICDRVLVMHGGRIVESGPTDRVLLEPEHPRTRELVHAAGSRHGLLP